MNRPTRGLPAALLALAICLALPLLAPAANAAEGAVTYHHVSLAQFEAQLAGGRIHAATINKRVRSARLTLNNGQHMLVKYLPHQEPQFIAKLQAKGVAVTVLAPSQAIKQAKKPVKHKLRYIAGGILIAVVIVVGAVVLIDRRRKLRD
jgi:hypothetical protein